jgi:lactate dehydrogenase-like 2-hydroxyacid dehydrogenase
MENTNTERKPLSELIIEAENKNMKIVIIGAGEVGSKVAEVIANKNFMGIHVANLTEKDQEMLERANKRTAFDPEPIMFKAPPVLPDMVLDSYKIDSKPFAGFRKKKLKGYQK